MGGNKKTPRKSLGDLDMASFLTSLGDDEDFNDDKVDDVSFVTARNGSEDDDGDNDANSDYEGDEKPSKPNKTSSSSSAMKQQQSAKKKKKEVSTPAATTKLSSTMETPKTVSKEKSNKKSKRNEDDQGMDVIVPSESTKKTTKKQPKQVESQEDEEVPSKATSDKKNIKKTKMAVKDNDSFESDDDDDKEDFKVKSKSASKPTRKEQEKTKPKAKKSHQHQEQEEEEEDDEEESHRQELLKLKESDPEFFKHLEKEGKDLLAFGDDDEDNEEHEDQEEEDEDEDDDEEEESHEEQKRDLTLPAVKKLEAQAQRGDAVATRKLMTCFRNAVRSVLARPDRKRTRKQIEESLERKDEKDVGGQEGWDEFEALSVPPEVLDRLVSISLTRIATGLDQIIWPDKQKKKDSQSKRTPLAKNSPQFASQEKKIRQFLSALTAALNSKDASPSILQHLLLSSRLFATYYGSFEKEARKNLETLVRIWAKPETENASRIASFFRIRQLCALRKDSLLEITIKDMYVQFARQAASPKTQESRDRMAVQARSLGEMYGLDMGLSYRVGFQHIRQLALHVRAAMASKSQESLQSVCSWRFVHCLRLWALILATHAPRLDELIFPFVQVALGVISLVSAPRYMPLRVHCIEAIQVVVSSNSEPVYVPVGLPLTQMLSVADLVQKKIVPATDPPPDLISMLRLKQDQMKKASTRMVLIPKIVETLRKHLELHRFSVAFPEIWLPVRLSLVKNVLYTKEGEENKHHTKSTKNKSNGGGESDAWRMAGAKAIRALVQDADNWADQVKKAREGRVAEIKRPGGPSDVDGCEKFQLALRTNLEMMEESKKKKKQKMSSSEEKEGEQVVSSALFPSSVEQAVDDILSEAAEMASSSSTAKSSIVNEEEDNEKEAEEEGNEKVERLNPKDFL